MAEDNYVPLRCGGCGISMRRRLKQDGSPTKKQASACGDTCKMRIKRGTFFAPDDLAPRQCAQCGGAYKPKQHGAMFCSKACGRLAWWVRRDPLHGKRRPACNGTAQQRSDRAKEARAAKAKIKALRSLALAISRVAKAKAKAGRYAKVCVECGAPFVSQVFRKSCSDECALARAKRISKQSPSAKASKRIRRKVGKMRKRAATVEVFDDLEILERDGWRCQICGVSTPRKLRGTFKPNAPEVDHIVAIARGGEHSRANTQCSCRRCNGAKSDGPAVGQIGLFSAFGYELGLNAVRGGGSRLRAAPPPERAFPFVYASAIGGTAPGGG